MRKQMVMLITCLVFVAGFMPKIVMGSWTLGDASLSIATEIIPSEVHTDVMYAANLMGFFVTDDKGLNWKSVKSAKMEYLAVSKTLPELIVAGDGGNEVYISNDSGSSWVNLRFDRVPLAFTCFNAFVNPADVDELFFLTDEGLFHLQKQAGGWLLPIKKITIEGFSSNFIHLEMVSTDPDTLYLISENGQLVIVSRRENTWQIQHESVIPPTFDSISSLSILESEMELYCGAVNGAMAKCSAETLDWQILETPPGVSNRTVSHIDCRDDLIIVDFFSRLFVLTSGNWIDLKSPVLEDGYLSVAPFESSLDIVVGSYCGCLIYNAYLRSWTVRNRGLDDLPVTSFSFFPKESKLVAMGTDGLGIFVSMDAGVSWSQSSLGNGFRVRAISRMPDSPDVMFAATSDGLFKSVDNGLNWIQTGHHQGRQLMNVTSVSTLSIDSGYRVLVGTGRPLNGSTLFWSDDMGATFASSVVSGANDVWVTFLEVYESDRQVVFAGGIAPTPRGVLLTSFDDGITFTDTSPEFVSPLNFPLDIVQHPLQLDDLWLSNQLLLPLSSNDAGETWKHEGALSDIKFGPVAIDYQGELICLVGNMSTSESPPVILTKDEGDWRPSHLLLPPFHYTHVESDPTRRRMWISGYNKAIWETIDLGETWTNLLTDIVLTPRTVNDSAVSPTNPDIVYMATEGDGVWKSIDAGWTWSQFNNGIPRSHHYVRTIDIDTRFPEDDTHRLMIGCAMSDDTFHRIYESTDSAVSWQRKDTSGDFNAKIVDLEMVEIPVENDDVWLATYGDGAWRSADGGQQWLKQSFESDPPGQFLTSINHTDYAAGGGEPWITASSHGGGGSFIYDPGQNQFRIRNHGLPGYTNNDVYVDLITPDPQRYGVLWAATDRGLFVTKDLGETWMPSLELDDAHVSSKTSRKSSISFNNGDICYTRQGSGVFRSQHGLTVDGWESLTEGLSNEELRCLTVVDAVGSSSRRRLLGCPAGLSPLAYPISSTVKSSGTDLVLSQPFFHAGDSFDLDLILSNNDEASREVGVVVLLELYGQYYWWPSWDTDFDYELFFVPPGQSFLDVLTFTWPTGSDHGNATIYSGMLSVEDGSLIGDIDWIAVGWKN